MYMYRAQVLTPTVKVPGTIARYQIVIPDCLKPTLKRQHNIRPFSTMLYYVVLCIGLRGSSGRQNDSHRCGGAAAAQETQRANC